MLHGVFCQRPSRAFVVKDSAATMRRPFAWAMDAAWRTQCGLSSFAQNSAVGMSACSL